MHFLCLPNELLLQVIGYLKPRARYHKPCDIYHLVLTNRRLAKLLLLELHVIACHNQDMSKEALYRAAAAKNENSVRFFLNNGIYFEVRQRNEDRLWPWKVIWNTRPKERVPGPCPDDVVAIVMEQGPNLVLDWINVEHSALHWAISRGDIGLAKDLLCQGAHLEFEYTRDWPAQTVWGTSAVTLYNPLGWESGALQKAVHIGDLVMVRLLLEWGVNLNIQDHLGRTALDAAVSAGHEVLVRMLLERGADINLRNKRGGTSFLEALRSGNIGIAQLLMDEGADTYVTEINGWNAMHIVADNEHDGMLLLLLNHYNPAYMLIRQKDKDGNTPLHIAARRGQVECVRSLQVFGADPKEKNNDGKPPFALVPLSEGPDRDEIKSLLSACGDCHNLLYREHEADLVDC